MVDGRVISWGISMGMQYEAFMPVIALYSGSILFNVELLAIEDIVFVKLSQL